MRYLCIILISTITLLGCQTTTFKSSGLGKFFQKYKDVKLDDGKWKVFVATEDGGGWNAIFDTTNYNLSGLVKELLDDCNKKKFKHNLRRNCEVVYLGQNRISYNSKNELAKLVNDYHNNPYQNVSSIDICSAAVNSSKTDWGNSRYLVNEAKSRNLTCGIPIKVAGNKNTNFIKKADIDLSKLSDIALCNVASIKEKGSTLYVWNENFPNHVNEAANRELDCNISTVDVQILSADSKKFEKPPVKDDIAVIIGNQNYTKYGQDIPNVDPARNDAQSFKSFAQTHLGIKSENIIYLSDAKTSDLERVFGNNRSHKGEAFNWVRKGKSNLYVYYAGHGAPGEDGATYIVPSDASASTIDLNGYPIETLYANLSKIPSKSTTVILESCFSGNSQSGTIITNASPVFMKAKETVVPNNLNVITAGSANQLASWTKDKKHGLFTYHYINGMSGEADGPNHGNENGEVDRYELEAYLEDTVSYLARRHYGRTQNVQISIAE